MAINPQTEVCTDQQTLQDKEKVMRKQRINSLFYSAGDTFKFLAGILVTVAMATLIPAIPAVMEASKLGVGAALAALPGVGVGMLAAAIITTGVAVTSGAIASRYYNAGNFDALEVNARHTAKYIVKELTQENPGRADGKTWVQATAQREASQQQSL